jgi:hypothetical protein
MIGGPSGTTTSTTASFAFTSSDAGWTSHAGKTVAAGVRHFGETGPVFSSEGRRLGRQWRAGPDWAHRARPPTLRWWLRRFRNRTLDAVALAGLTLGGEPCGTRAPRSWTMRSGDREGRLPSPACRLVAPASNDSKRAYMQPTADARRTDRSLFDGRFCWSHKNLPLL